MPSPKWLWILAQSQRTIGLQKQTGGWLSQHQWTEESCVFAGMRGGRTRLEGYVCPLPEKQNPFCLLLHLPSLCPFHHNWQKKHILSTHVSGNGAHISQCFRVTNYFVLLSLFARKSVCLSLLVWLELMSGSCMRLKDSCFPWLPCHLLLYILALTICELQEKVHLKLHCVCTVGLLGDSCINQLHSLQYYRNLKSILIFCCCFVIIIMFCWRYWEVLVLCEMWDHT